MLLNFKPAGCEDNMNKTAMKNHVNKKFIEYEDYEDDDDDYENNDEFVFDFNDSKKAPSVNNFFDSQKVSNNHEVQEPKPLLLINKQESDLVIDFKQAIINHNVDKVKRLLDENIGEINVNYVFNNSWSPLMYAITSGCFELIDYFISKGANVNHKADRVTVLMCACACRRIDDVRLVEIVELLIKAGANYHSTDRYCITPLMFASREGNLRVLKYLIEFTDINIDQQDENGWTSLIYACNKGYIECVRELLRNNANPNICSLDYSYPTDFAQNNGHPKIKELIDKFVRTEDLNIDESIGGNNELDKMHDDLQTFLSIIRMPHLIDVFVKNKIYLKDLLNFKSEDFDKIGIIDSSTKITLLDEISKAHKENWKPSSLVPLKYSFELNPHEISGMMINMSRHCDFMASTIKFIYSETSLENSDTIKEYSNTCHNLKKEIDLVVNSSKNLNKEVSFLAENVLKKFPLKTNCEGDFIKEKPTGFINLKKILIISSTLAVSAFIFKKLIH